MIGKQTDPVFLEYYEKLMTGKLDGFERLLKKQKYLAGDVRSLSFFCLFFFFSDKDLTGYSQEISVIDIFCLPYGHTITKGGYDYLKSDKWPNVARWWADISTRPSWQLVKNGIPEEYNGE